MINLYDVKPGQKVRLRDGSLLTVVENMGDGQWVEAKADDAPEDAEPDLVHAQDIVEIVDGA